MEEMKRIVTTAQMKQIERNADESGLSYYDMMENAGTAAAEYIKTQIGIAGKKVVIFCGKGNNGGDGFVAARLLYQECASMNIVLVDGEPQTEDASVNFKLAVKAEVSIAEFNCDTNSPEYGETADITRSADVIIDAVYGTGFHGKFRRGAREAVKLMNASSSLLVSFDIPSGVNGDTGEADADGARAAFTIAFDSYKPAHFMEKSAAFFGKSVCVDIGISEACHDFLEKGGKGDR